MDKTTVDVKVAEFPTKCPKLATNVLLVTLQGLRLARGLDVPRKINELSVTPSFLKKLATPKDRDALEFARRADPSLWAVVDGASHVGMLLLGKHTPAVVLDAKGVAITPDRLTTKPAQFIPGSLDGWLLVIEKQTGNPICQVNTNVKHEASVVRTTTMFGETELADLLHKQLVIKLAQRLEKASGAKLVDETGPVVASASFRSVSK